MMKFDVSITCAYNLFNEMINESKDLKKRDFKVVRDQLILCSD